MRSLRFAAGLVAGILIHSAGLWLAPQFTLAVDVFLVLLVFNGRDGNTLAGMLGGMAAGLVSDALSGGPFGLYGLVDTMVGYGTAYASQRLVIQRAAGVFLLFSLAAAAQQVLLMGVALVIMPEPEFAHYYWVVVKVATSGLLGVMLFAARSRLTTRVEGWRRSRTAKIRFER